MIGTWSKVSKKQADLKGIKETSGLIVISSNASEAVPGTAVFDRVDLQLNPLDNEVFVVYGIDIDVTEPELIAGTLTTSRASISTTLRTTIGGIDQPNVLAASRIATQDNGVTAVTNTFSSDSAPSTQLPYLGIIATNDFYLNVQGNNNVGTVSANARLYGVRGRADSSVYSALVQSELLSA
jgi:hypothetical protein